MSFSSFFSSFLPTTYADAPEEKEDKQESEPTEDKAEDKADDAEESGDEPAAEEEEEEEPEDVRVNLKFVPSNDQRSCQVMPAIREECAQSSKCAPLTKHFEHCQEKVQAGEGFKHEDCVEEL